MSRGTSTGVFGEAQTPSPFSSNTNFGTSSSTPAFGKSSSPSSFSQSVFGLQNNSSNNPFAPKPSGSPTLFGLETCNSMSRGTSTGVFGEAQTPSPFSSNTNFGTSSSTPAFGKSSSPSSSSQSVFGMQNNSGNNLFAPKPSGSPTLFGLETCTSMSRGTSTGVFGAAQTPSPFSSNTNFGTSSSTPAFGKPLNPSSSSHSVFGLQNNSSNNFFAPKPSGCPTLFGSETGNSMSGVTSKGVFGAGQTLCPVSSDTNFGASSSTPAFDFGQLSSPSSSSRSMFGQQNTSSNNFFAPKSFGSPTPFVSETGNSMSRGTATGVFGTAQTPSPFSSNTNFGASSSTSAFGNKSSSSRGSSLFGQEPAFVGFGSTPTQTSPCRSAIQPSRPAFGSNAGHASLYGSLSIHDQHRDMRMDISGMSYEELLALGERIGYVNTGLSESLISKYLTKTLYCSAEQSQEGTCAICLEEYKNMDSIGTLETCGHDYHVSCIRKWLSMKNLCPICKVSALPDE
ncbi:nuclear pore complex protein NUP98B isoform X1 [Medicago truncatula]|nr:nuclear pore complex protein NUP98B isoform X1 [Medicago truncatula]